MTSHQIFRLLTKFLITWHYMSDYNNPITLASTFNMFFLLIRLQTFVQSFHCLRAHYIIYNCVITRRDSDFASNFSIANKISDHMALHVSLACQRPHPERKEVYVRALRR